MSSLLGRRAIVIGAGIGGLSIAGALANSFEQVEVLERDRLAGALASRKGTPQDRHPTLCWLGAFRRWKKFSPVSRISWRELVPSRSGSRKRCSSSFLSSV